MWINLLMLLLKRSLKYYSVINIMIVLYVVLFGCYIRSEHSTRGRMSHEVFSYLSTHIYQDVTDMDCILICGDINATIGSLSDTIVGVGGEIPNRTVLDSV